MWLCFESLTPTVSEFLNLNLSRIGEILSLKPELTPFAPFSILLHSILALNCRADQVALHALEEFSVSACKGHALWGYLLAFMKIRDFSAIACTDICILIMKRFGSKEFVEYKRLQFKDSAIDFSTLQMLLNSLEQKDWKYLLEAASK